MNPETAARRVSSPYQGGRFRTPTPGKPYSYSPRPTIHMVGAITMGLTYLQTRAEVKNTSKHNISSQRLREKNDTHTNNINIFLNDHFINCRDISKFLLTLILLSITLLP